MRHVKIAIDLDSTLNTLFSEWSAWFEKNYDPKFTLDKWTHWDIHKLQPHGADIFRYLDIEGVFRNSGVQPHSQRVVRRMLREGHEVYVVTSCNMHPGRHSVIGEKMYWMAEHFPLIPTKNLIICSNKSLIDADVLIDDGLHNLENFNGRKIVFDGPWNRSDNRWDRAHSWIDVERLVLGPDWEGAEQ